MENTKFYTFEQSNIGGRYIQDENIAEHVIFEAIDASEAILLAESIGINVQDYCECCGGRWDVPYRDEYGEDEPMINSKSVFEIEARHSASRAIIHYKSGKKIIVSFKEEEF